MNNGGVDLGSANCALCQKFKDSVCTESVGSGDAQRDIPCPVKKSTGMSFCYNTTYYKFRGAANSVRVDLAGDEVLGSSVQNNESRGYANAMLMLLVDLLPAGETHVTDSGEWEYFGEASL